MNRQCDERAQHRAAQRALQCALCIRWPRHLERQYDRRSREQYRERIVGHAGEIDAKERLQDDEQPQQSRVAGICHDSAEATEHDPHRQGTREQARKAHEGERASQLGGGAAVAQQWRHQRIGERSMLGLVEGYGGGGWSKGRSRTTCLGPATPNARPVVLVAEEPDVAQLIHRKVGTGKLNHRAQQRLGDGGAAEVRSFAGLGQMHHVRDVLVLVPRLEGRDDAQEHHTPRNEESQQDQAIRPPAHSTTRAGVATRDGSCRAGVSSGGRRSGGARGAVARGLPGTRRRCASCSPG